MSDLNHDEYFVRTFFPPEYGRYCVERLQPTGISSQPLQLKPTTILNSGYHYLVRCFSMELLVLSGIEHFLYFILQEDMLGSNIFIPKIPPYSSSSMFYL